MYEKESEFYPVGDKQSLSDNHLKVEEKQTSKEATAISLTDMTSICLQL